jgi:hypothetical protein
MESKTLLHNTKTLEKIKSYIKELKQDIKLIKQELKDIQDKSNSIDDDDYEFKKIELEENLRAFRYIIRVLQENLELNSDIINLYLNYNDNKNYNNLPNTIQSLIIVGYIEDDYNICNFPITLERILHSTYKFSKLNIPFNCKYSDELLYELSLETLEENKIDINSVYEIVFYKDLQLYTNMDFIVIENSTVLESKSSEFYPWIR